MNPSPSSTRYPATLTNTEIRKRTEITGFFEVITRIPDRIAAIERKSRRKLFIVKNRNKINRKLYNKLIY